MFNERQRGQTIRYVYTHNHRMNERKCVWERVLPVPYEGNTCTYLLILSYSIGKLYYVWRGFVFEGCLELFAITVCLSGLIVLTVICFDCLLIASSYRGGLWWRIGSGLYYIYVGSRILFSFYNHIVLISCFAFTKWYQHMLISCFINELRVFFKEKTYLKNTNSLDPVKSKKNYVELHLLFPFQPILISWFAFYRLTTTFSVQLFHRRTWKPRRRKI